MIHTGYHAVYESSYRDAIDTARRNGFSFVQIDLGVPTFFLDDLSARELLDIKTHAADQGVALTFHAPGDNVSLFCDYPQIRRGNLEQFKRILDAANRLEARHITFHTGQHPAFKKIRAKADDFSREFAGYYAAVLRENILTLVAHTQATLLCFENSGFTPLIMAVLDALLAEGHPLWLTLDTAKAYTPSLRVDQPVVDFMLAHRGAVREIHIHDRNREYGGHQVVGDGGVDFSLFSDWLFQESVYMNFEVRPVEGARESKQRLFRLFGKTGG